MAKLPRNPAKHRTFVAFSPQNRHFLRRVAKATKLIRHAARSVHGSRVSDCKCLDYMDVAPAIPGCVSALAVSEVPSQSLLRRSNLAAPPLFISRQKDRPELLRLRCPRCLLNHYCEDQIGRPRPFLYPDKSTDQN